MDGFTVNSDREKNSVVSGSSDKFLIIIALIGVTVGVVILYLYFATFSGELSLSQNIWGQFGDFVGGALNPLFGFLGLLALLMTLRLQSKELVFANQELEKSTKLLIKQGQSLKKQNTENTFFQLLNLHKNIVTDLDIRNIKLQRELYSGRDCFKHWLKLLGVSYSERVNKNEDVKLSQSVKYSYGNFYNSHESDLGHYFRNLYRIVKFVDDEITDDPKFYTGLIRAQLSSAELAVLFYNGLSEFGIKFKPLLEKYAIFESINIDLLFDPNQHINLYKDEAFGDLFEMY